MNDKQSASDLPSSSSVSQSRKLVFGTSNAFAALKEKTPKQNNSKLLMMVVNAAFATQKMRRDGYRDVK